MKKVLLWGIGIIVVLVVIGSLLGEDESADDTAQESKESASAEEDTEGKTEANADEGKEEPEETKAKIGEEFELGELTFLVESVEEKERAGDDILGKDASGTFKVVKVSVTNNSKEAIMMDSSFFTLIEDDGTEYSSDSEASMYIDPESSFFIEEINPKTTKTGYVAFDIPEDVGGLELQVQTGFWGTETGVISLE